MTLWWEGSDDMAGTWWQRIGQGEAEWKKPLKFPSWVTLGWRAFVWARESMGRAAPLVWESVKECILRCSFFFPSAYGFSPCKTGMIRERAIPFSSPCPAATLCLENQDGLESREGTKTSREPVPPWNPLPTLLLPAFLSYGSRKAAGRQKDLKKVNDNALFHFFCLKKASYIKKVITSAYPQIRTQLSAIAPQIYTTDPWTKWVWIVRVHLYANFVQ